MTTPAKTTELYRNDFMAVTDDGDTITLAWTREEPNDDHAVATAESVKKVLTDHVAANPGRRVKVMVDLIVVKKTFPRSTAVYAGWLIGNRAVIRGGAFVTKSFLLRAGVSAALLVPGLTMKGFTDLSDASAFLARV